MTVRTLLVIKSAVCFGFGVFLLVAPASLLGLLGASLGAGGHVHCAGIWRGNGWDASAHMLGWSIAVVYGFIAVGSGLTRTRRSDRELGGRVTRLFSDGIRNRLVVRDYGGPSTVGISSGIG